jgi:hypothetical protein
MSNSSKSKTMKRNLLILFVLIYNTAQSQSQEEKVAADGSHYIEFIPRHYTEEELTNWKPRRIPTTAEVRKNPLIPLSNLFMIKLESEFKIIVVEDSSLVEASDIHFRNHLGINNSIEESYPVRYHQIWDLKESVQNYLYTDFSQSLVDMLRENDLEKYLSQTIQFYCKEYQYNDKYYLVVVIND